MSCTTPHTSARKRVAARKPGVWPAHDGAVELHGLVREVAAELVEQDVQGRIEAERAFFSDLFENAKREHLTRIRALYRQGGAVYGDTDDGFAQWLMDVFKAQDEHQSFDPNIAQLMSKGPLPDAVWEKSAVSPALLVGAAVEWQASGRLAEAQKYHRCLGRRPLSFDALRRLALRWGLRKLERVVYVVRCPYPSIGCCFVSPVVPLVVILVDSRLPAEAARQVLAHEVGHLIAGHKVEGEALRFARGDEDRAEAEADAFRYLATDGAR